VVAPDSSAGNLDALEGHRIRRIDIAARNIFDPLPHGRLRGAYRLANALHIRTRESTVRELLLLQRGDLWTAERAAETIRRLRELEFLIPERLEARLMNDSVDVTVRTVDTWTTSPQFDLQRSGTTQFSTVAVAEGNVLGHGKSVSVAYHQDETGVTRSIEWNDPAFLGSRAQIDFGAARGASGKAYNADAGVRFLAPSTPHEYFADTRSIEGIDRLYSFGAETANLDVRREETEAMWGIGRESDGLVRRGVMSFAVIDRHLGPTRTLTPGPPEFQGGDERLRLRRVALEGLWWRPRYIERTGVNRMDRIEDFDVGLRLGLKLGVSPRFLGSTADEGYTRASADIGIPDENAFGLFHASFETWYRRAVRDEIQNLSGRWVAPLGGKQTLVVSAVRLAGYDVSRDFQITAGGLTGLRAYAVHELTGTRLLRLNAEDRWNGPEFWELVSLGAAVFYDAAHMRGPGADGTPWRHDAGIGLRLAFPRSALDQVLRFDVAIPIDPVRSSERRPVLSFGSSQAF
jgi:hypothetical protein